MTFRGSLCSAIAAVGILTTAAACQDGSAPAANPPHASLRVLFIGNSLTYTNDLPGALMHAARTGGDTIYVEMIAKPNYALIDHLTSSSDAEAAIRRGGWDYVVLQQGPTTLPINRDSLILWTRMFDPIIRSVGARPALFMVWPPAGQAGGFEAVRASYQAAAAAVDGVFLPAGAAWQDALQRDGTLALYGGDQFHPGPLGSYLAAITIYETLTEHDARQLSDSAFVNGAVLDVPAATVRLLQEAAHRAATVY